VDDYATYVRDLEKRIEAGQDVAIELLTGAELLSSAAKRASGTASSALASLAQQLGDAHLEIGVRIDIALSSEAASLAREHPDPRTVTRYDRSLAVDVDPVIARFGAWYEFFPRSTGPADRHGTFDDAHERLEYVASLGFDVVYLPPIHPIGRTARKGRNNSLVTEPGDPGSPWAIGAREGGHKAIHPSLGTFEDFERFRRHAESLGLRIALDVAFQTSPDHPYVTEHPEWFRHRPDGTIRYAENPPKKYEDIYPFDFGTEAFHSLWEELASVFFFWIDRGVRIFRVDNPHTKSLRFWEWCIAEVKARHPDIVFLSEAFTRPKLMYALAKLGFSQSYTYFTWRVTKNEIETYMHELTRTEVAEHFRPSFWPNTPDILPSHLVTGGRGAFAARAVLASMLSSTYGVYGPPFELMEHVPRPGTEEYVDNEKYQLRSWHTEDPRSLAPLLARLNRIRRAHPALHDNRSLRFHRVENEQLLSFSKRSDDRRDVILVFVNLDPHHTQAGFVDLDLGELGVAHDEAFHVEDLLSGARYEWRGTRSFIELDPTSMPAHVFRVDHASRNETSFEYYL
ncbi:MAG: DUF3416 domain-containing protein, partial [Polyangiaceae bacterium]|nr:DUF3416 domain-containing protein [Polyangiaceae bacterium]